MDNPAVDAIKAARNVCDTYVASTKDKHYPHIMPVIPAHPIDGRWVAPASGVVSTIADIKNIKVEVTRVPGMDTLIGYMKRYETEAGSLAHIVYSSELNLCWSRLIISKEAMHLLLGHDGVNFTIEKEEIEDLISNLLSPTAGAMYNEDFVVETTAVLGAIELLLPCHQQKNIRDMFEAGCTAKDVALSYRIPENLVELRYSRPIKTLFDDAYQDA